MPRIADTLAPRRALVLLATALTLVAAPARADSERLVLGTHDAALASALSVAVSPRGLSVVELPDPLVRVDDAEAARRELAVPGTVAVVWLCDAGAAAHGLCFCGAGGQVVFRPITVASPLAPPDAAALALSVKMMLGAPASRAPGPATPPAPAPPPTIAAVVPPAIAFPTLALELDVGARLQPPAAQHAGLRVGVAGVLAPAALGRALGLGLAIAGGPSLAASAPAGRTLDDWSTRLFARGRLIVAPAWLELDAGPSLHVLSVASGPSAPGRADLALDALAGAVVPVGRLLLGLRAGGFYVVSASAASGATVPAALPRWNGEVLLTLGFGLR